MIIPGCRDCGEDRDRHRRGKWDNPLLMLLYRERRGRRGKVSGVSGQASGDA